MQILHTGCNTIIATKTAMNLAEYVVTEAGFGSDLGAEKFLNIKCREAGVEPSAIVLVVSLRAIKEFGSIENGILNVKRHLENLKAFEKPVLICVNRFEIDDKEEIEKIKEILNKEYGNIVIECTSWKDGGKGAKEIALRLTEECQKESTLKHTYNIEDNIEEKIQKLNNQIYKADEIIYEEKAKEKLNILKEELKNKYICMAKSPYEFTNGKKGEKDLLIIKDIEIANGSNFAIIYCGDIMFMPGLPKNPQAERIFVTEKRRNNRD